MNSAHVLIEHMDPADELRYPLATVTSLCAGYNEHVDPADGLPTGYCNLYVQDMMNT